MLKTSLGNQSKLKTKFRRGIVMLLMSGVLTYSVFSVAALNRTVFVNADGEQQQINTMSNDVDEILTRVGVKLSKNDTFNTAEADGNMTINVKRAFPVYIDMNGKTTEYKITGGTVADLLKKANITLTEKQLVTPAVTEKLTEDLTVSIANGNAITVTADGKTTNHIVPQGTVVDTLKALNITLGKSDIINCNKKDTVTDGMAIVINRVIYRDVTTKETIPFETIETESTEIEAGETEIKTNGVNGEYTVVTRQKLVDGKIVKTAELSREITKQAVHKEVIVGVEPQVESENVFYDMYGNAVSYSAVHYGSGTAYTAPAGALTASGTEVFEGGVAVNPNIIPLGSKLYIVADDGYTYGYATAVDTGGALYDGSAIVDLFYFSESQCYEFGRRNVSVYVLE